MTINERRNPRDRPKMETIGDLMYETVRAYLRNHLDPPTPTIQRVDTVLGSLACILRSPVSRSHINEFGEVATVSLLAPRVWSAFPCHQAEDGDLLVYLVRHGRHELTTLSSLWHEILEPIEKLIMFVMLTDTNQQNSPLVGIFNGDRRVMTSVYDKIERDYHHGLLPPAASPVEPSKAALSSRAHAAAL